VSDNKDGIIIGPEVMISDIVNGVINKTSVSEKVEIIEGIHVWIENKLFSTQRQVPYLVIISDTRDSEPKQYSLGVTMIPPMGPAQIANSIMTSILLMGNILTGNMPKTLSEKDGEGVEKHGKYTD